MDVEKENQLQPGALSEPLSLEAERRRLAELERLIEEQLLDMESRTADDEPLDHEARLLDINTAYDRESLRLYRAGRRRRITAEDL